ncbi:hypothetical protein [Natranaeroarchaeum aerophilus]|uniref:Uncharacterized protein n=1 Tax=Natranaeroarchaeum aerophilus TaxID=2917711 RepID=A0AAE3K4F7_9EURY|nr:hypothetical protein [Natranaeroarchaeum aerophilus]MCL9813223.1 hypothetical protein [Natranaeroarchaeum aerophilus]
MSSDRPTESISGNGEWQWNRQRESNRSIPRPDETARRCELEAELERKEQRLQTVIQQYERRLAETERQLARERSSNDGDTRPSLYARIVGYLSR